MTPQYFGNVRRLKNKNIDISLGNRLPRFHIIIIMTPVCVCVCVCVFVCVCVCVYPPPPCSIPNVPRDLKKRRRHA